MTSWQYDVPQHGTLGWRFLKVAELYLNQATDKTVINVTPRRLELVGNCRDLGRALYATLKTIALKEENILKLNIPRVGNDNREGVLGGILKDLGLTPKDTIGAALQKLATVLIKIGCSSPLIDPAKKAQLPQLMKVNYLEYTSAFLHSAKKKIEVPYLVVLLSSLGAIACALPSKVDNYLIYTLPGEDVETLGLTGLHRKIIKLLSQLNKMPTLVKLLAVAAQVSMTVGNVPDYVAEELLIQGKKRFTLLNSYSFNVGFITSRLNKKVSKLLLGLIRAASVQGNKEKLYSIVTRFANHLVGYFSTDSTVHKYMAVRELTSIEWALRYGVGEDSRSMKVAFTNVNIQDPLAFIASLKYEIAHL